MSKVMLEEMIAQLTEKQQHLLYEAVIRRRDEQITEPQLSDIAIIGLSGRYPQADNHYDFWSKILEGTNLVQGVPASRWDHSEYYDPQAKKRFNSHKTCCKFGAFLEPCDEFDPSFFDIPTDEVLYMDPQERIALETTWSCIEDAGYIPSELDKDVGVFSGLTYNEYQKLVPFSLHSFFLNSKIAHFFDFQGPTITVDAGCASSLRAIDLACQSLIKKDCKTAIVIGANMILHPHHYTSASLMLSPTAEPNSNPFGTDDGWIPAEGVVSLIIKPLKQALQDRDHIYAVIKSSLVYQSGKTSWLSAPDPKKQAKLIRENFRKSGIHPETISYVETAANGSSFGDAIEMNGLITAFNQFTNKKQFCPIGSIKSNVGHAEGVSSLFQITKLLLQFKAKTIFPIINLTEINPNIILKDSPFYLQTSIRRWETPKVNLKEKQFPIPRRATISSFSASGDIGHLILEEHIREVVKKKTFTTYFIPLSSKTANQLQQTIEKYIEFFTAYQKFDSEWEANYTLLNMMFTLCVGRTPFEERVVFIVNDLEGLIKQFHKFSDGGDDPNTVFKVKTTVDNEIIEFNKAHVQSYLENQSWHDLAELWVQGAQVPWREFFKTYDVQRIPLPTYVFQRQSYPIPKPTLQ